MEHADNGTYLASLDKSAITVCFLELQYTGDLFTATTKPVIERRLVRSPPQSESMGARRLLIVSDADF